jgi:hypothetical protein
MAVRICCPAGSAWLVSESSSSLSIASARRGLVAAPSSSLSLTSWARRGFGSP